MIWPFKKKASTPAISANFPKNPQQFGEFASGMIDQADDPTRAMCVVGIENMKPMIAAMRDPQIRGTKPVDPDEELVAHCRALERPHKSELSLRKGTWLVMGHVVMRFDEHVRQAPALQDQAVAIWLKLAEAGQYIPNLLQKNVVWTEQDKEWFALCKTPADAQAYVVKYSMPKAYKSHPKVRDFADRHRIFLI